MATVKTHITPELARLLLKQLRRRGVTSGQVAHRTGVAPGQVVGFTNYPEFELDNDDWNRLVSYLRVEMERAGRKGEPFLLSVEEVRAKRGSRLGTVNRTDPTVKPLIQALYDDWVSLGRPPMTEYAKTGNMTLSVCALLRNYQRGILPRTLFARTRQPIERYLIANGRLVNSAFFKTDTDTKESPVEDERETPAPAAEVGTDAAVSDPIMTLSQILTILRDHSVQETHAIIRALVAWHGVTL